MSFLFMMFGIDPVVSQHLKVFFWDMYDQAFDEFHGRDAFFDGLIIFVSGIVKGYVGAVIFINARGSNDGTSEITTDIFDCDIRGAGIGFGIDIEAIRMVFIDLVFQSGERRSDAISQFFQEDLAESKTEESVVEVLDRSPRSDISCSAFGDESMDMRVPFKIPAESMEDTNESRSKEFCFVILKKHTKDNIPDGGEEKFQS